eukprot:m.60906 g.60906  ORF g.60906 m.60906 type:complete len:53 (-) comp22903_c0_seq1:345-503(-)
MCEKGFECSKKDSTVALTMASEYESERVDMHMSTLGPFSKVVDFVLTVNVEI